MWEVITKKNDIEVSYRWFATRKKAEAFAFTQKEAREREEANKGGEE